MSDTYSSTALLYHLLLDNVALLMFQDSLGQADLNWNVVRQLQLESKLDYHLVVGHFISRIMAIFTAG